MLYKVKHLWGRTKLRLNGVQVSILKNRIISPFEERNSHSRLRVTCIHQNVLSPAKGKKYSDMLTQWIGGILKRRMRSCG